MKNPKSSEKKTNKLNTLLELRSQKDFELNVKETEKIGTRTKRDNSGYNLPVFDNFKSKMLGELRRVKYKGLEDMVYRMELTYDEILGIPDRKEFAGSTFGYTYHQDIIKVVKFTLLFKSSLPDEVKVNVTIADIRQRSNLTTEKTKKFPKNHFSIQY